VGNLGRKKAVTASLSIARIKTRRYQTEFSQIKGITPCQQQLIEKLGLSDKDFKVKIKCFNE
jgi:hypothetical protein